MWKKVLREYFAFPKKERRGLWVLFVIWLVIITTQFLLDFYSEDFSFQISPRDSIIAFDAKNNITLTKPKVNFYRRTSYFKYIKEDQLLAAGLTEASVSSILHARDTGLKIYTISDLAKLKVDSSVKRKLISILKFFPERKYYQPNFENKFEREKMELKNINTMDSAEFDLLKGISSSLAGRIIKYRSRLIFFHNKEQLKEVWGMDSASYNRIASSTYIKKDSLEKININKADVKILGAHPYIGYKLAKIIVNYRDQHGSFEKVEDLLKIHVLNEEIFSKIEPYISVE